MFFSSVRVVIESSAIKTTRVDARSALVGGGALVAVLGLKLAVFTFVVAGIPFVRLTWSHHGGRFRRSP